MLGTAHGVLHLCTCTPIVVLFYSLFPTSQAGDRAFRRLRSTTSRHSRRRALVSHRKLKSTARESRPQSTSATACGVSAHADAVIRTCMPTFFIHPTSHCGPGIGAHALYRRVSQAKQHYEAQLAASAERHHASSKLKRRYITGSHQVLKAWPPFELSLSPFSHVLQKSPYACPFVRLRLTGLLVPRLPRWPLRLLLGRQQQLRTHVANKKQ